MPTILLPCQDKVVYIQIRLLTLHCTLALLPVGHSISDIYTLLFLLFSVLFSVLFNVLFST